jgi:hypothetical protein
MTKIRRRVRKWVGNKCWDIGDWFMGQWIKRIDPGEMEGWHKIDVHANCQPKQPTITISSPATHATGDDRQHHLDGA